MRSRSRKTDGTTVDVRLDDKFDVIAVESDSEEAGDGQDRRPRRERRRARPPGREVAAR